MINAQQQAAAAAAAAARRRGRLTPAPPTNLPNPPASTLGGQAVAIADHYLGVPYVWGGTAPTAASTAPVWSRPSTPRSASPCPAPASEQWYTGPHVPVSQLQPGDLVFYATDLSNPGSIHHVGIYVGGGVMIDAPHTGTVVQFSSLSGGGSFAGAARVPG